jgi:MraZ protein
MGEGVAVFIGTYDHSLDPKGRVILPRKFRDELGQDMVVTKGIERCLYVFPLAEFQAFADKLRKLPLTERPSRDFVRVFVAGASQETADSQGRVVIPQPLREWAGLTRDVVLLGQIRRVEIWDKAEWERYRAVAEAAYADETNAAHLAELGI